VEFSLIFEAQLPHPTPDREKAVLRSCVEQAVFAEEMGFDRIWAVEHHGLRRYAHMTSPEIFLSWVAARTSRIRIGHGVVCMPFNYNHPVRVAERAAMLDVLSNGRLDLGAGRGGTIQEMTLFGVDVERTAAEVREALCIIGSAWRGEGFEWHGEMLDIVTPPVGEHRIMPEPVQLPHPPLYLACTSPQTIVTAANYGVGALIFGFGGLDEVRMKRKMYDEAVATRTGDELVSTEIRNSLSALCPTIVLNDDPERAKQIGAGGQRFFTQSSLHWYAGAPEPDEDTENDDNIEYMRSAGAKVTAQLEAAGIELPPGIDPTSAYNVDHAYGNAHRAIEYVEALEDAGADEILAIVQMGTVPYDVCMETIRQWGETVIPYFRKREG
jgi:alkanesulfonate monooxygenase SsuD/methylene tetrahydromethanopterin reductase-like flavin-dependent oxidoreductase (luciferase family)